MIMRQPTHYQTKRKLTQREREVLAEIQSAATNREIGRKLGISSRTVEVHRARIMEKLGAKNAVDLMRIVNPQRLSACELGTVLAALRYWQEHRRENRDPSIWAIAIEAGSALTNIEIDALCERLNR